jgi:hypothetical protein
VVREPKSQSTRDTSKNLTQIQRKRNSPTQKDNLVPLPTILLLKLEIIDGPSTLGLGEISHKLIVVFLTRRLIDHDLFKVFAEGEEDILVLLLQLEILECSDAVGVDANSGRLFSDGEDDNKICAQHGRTIVNVVVVGSERGL